MRWYVEDIGVHCNILIEDLSQPKDEWAPVGMGFPKALAERLVKMHNEGQDSLIRENARLKKDLDMVTKALDASATLLEGVVTHRGGPHFHED